MNSIHKQIRKIATSLVALSLSITTTSQGVSALEQDNPSRSVSTKNLSKTITQAITDSEALLDKTGASSLSIALSDQHGLLWTETLGMKDISGIKPSTDTMYAAASVTKMITTIAIMQLVEEGKIELDTPITAYIKEFQMLSPDYRKITTRMLLSHSAGLGTDYANGMTHKHFSGYLGQVMKTLSRTKLQSTPGELSSYSNDGFTLAGEIIQRVSGQDYTSYVKRNILLPLGMNSSTFITKDNETKRVAKTIENKQELPYIYNNLSAAGAIVTTPTDLAKLGRMLLNQGNSGGKKILSKTSIVEMGKQQGIYPIKTKGHSSTRFGLGWDHVNVPALSESGIKAWKKTGATLDQYSILIVAPKQNLVVAAQMAGGNKHDLWDKLAPNIILSATGEKKLKPTERGPRDSLTRPKRIKPATGSVDKAVGLYIGDGFKRITKDGNKLKINYLDRENNQWIAKEGRYTYSADGQYWNKNEPFDSIEFVNSNGNNYLVHTSPAIDTGIRMSNIMQKRKANLNATPQWKARIKETWLNVSARTESILWDQRERTQKSFHSPLDFQGIFFSFTLWPLWPVSASQDNNIASPFLKIQGTNSRDQNSVVVLKRDNFELLSIGSQVFYPLSQVKELANGINQIQFNSQGHAEWRLAKEDLTVSVSPELRWKTWDKDGSLKKNSYTNQFNLKKGEKVLFFGLANSTHSVTVASSY